MLCGFSVVLCASVGYCVICKNNTRSENVKYYVWFIYVYIINSIIYIYNVNFIQRKYNILDASKETGSKVTQKRNN